MTQEALTAPTEKSTSQISDLSILDLILEMQRLDMDPQPFLEIAARDISAQHGEKGLSYTKIMMDRMIDLQDKGGIYLWTALHTILNNDLNACIKHYN